MALDFATLLYLKTNRDSSSSSYTNNRKCIFHLRKTFEYSVNTILNLYVINLTCLHLSSGFPFSTFTACVFYMCHCKTAVPLILCIVSMNCFGRFQWFHFIFFLLVLFIWQEMLIHLRITTWDEASRGKHWHIKLNNFDLGRLITLGCLE